MTQNRQPRGIPAGGEFAANQHDEASGELAGERTQPWETEPSAIAVGGTSVYMSTWEDLAESVGAEDGVPELPERLRGSDDTPFWEEEGGVFSTRIPFRGGRIAIDESQYDRDVRIELEDGVDPLDEDEADQATFYGEMIHLRAKDLSESVASAAAWNAAGEIGALIDPSREWTPEEREKAETDAAVHDRIRLSGLKSGEQHVARTAIDLMRRSGALSDEEARSLTDDDILAIDRQMRDAAASLSFRKQ